MRNQFEKYQDVTVDAKVQKGTKAFSDCRSMTQQSAQKVRKARERTRREREIRESFCASGQIRFPSGPRRATFASAIGCCRTIFGKCTLLQYRYTTASRACEASGHSRIFIDDTFRPERFKLSLFWQVNLRFTIPPLFCPDLQSSQLDQQLKSYHHAGRPAMTGAPISPRRDRTGESKIISCLSFVSLYLL